MTAPIGFDDVWRAYGKKVALKGLNMEVQRGEVVALLGRNGAGKTTAIKILLGHIRASKGKAYLCGQEAWEVDPVERRKVGLMTEGNHLDPWMKIGELVRFTSSWPYPQERCQLFV